MAVPADPTSLVATVIDAGDIDLSWTDNATDETGFRIERSLTTLNDWSKIGQTGINEVTFRERFAVPAVTYDYRVFAFNVDGDSLPSNVVSAVTPLPPSLTISAPPVAPVNPPRNQISPENVEFNSPGVYGLEKDANGDITGFKF
jgi:titin